MQIFTVIKLHLFMKMVYLRGTMKQDIGVRNASEIVKLLRENIESKTEKFQKFIIKEMEPCQRPSSKDLTRKSEPITGINKMHSLKANPTYF